MKYLLRDEAWRRGGDRSYITHNNLTPNQQTTTKTSNQKFPFSPFRFTPPVLATCPLQWHSVSPLQRLVSLLQWPQKRMRCFLRFFTAPSSQLQWRWTFYTQYGSNGMNSWRTQSQLACYIAKPARLLRSTLPAANAPIPYSRNRPIPHTNIQVSSAFNRDQGPHSRGPYILCLRTPSPAFAITPPRLPHLPWDFQLQQWHVPVPMRQPMDPFAMPTDRRKDSRFGTKLGGEEGIVLRACLERSFDRALSYQREPTSRLAPSEAWRPHTICNFHILYILVSSDLLSSSS